jgi:UDP-N-acetylmuramate: L-alanyl-gamma-D-glutamyl-meso-diaminopimelate ligase
MDVQGKIDDILVVDDFAHHPTAIRATIEAARLRWPRRRLWAILEPRSNSMRRRVFQDSLPQSLALGDRVVLGSVHRAALLSDGQRLEPESVAAAIRQLGKDARVLPGADAIADFLVAEAQPGDLLLVMSNGSFDGLCEKLLKRLSARQSHSEAHTR